MNSSPTPLRVLPQSVYVWRGYKSANTTFAQFAQFLGSVFVPACALLQPRAGLRAYLPTLLPQAGKPAGVPDQTALMFWATPTAHDEANAVLAVRVYQNLHGDAYDMSRKAPEKPLSIAGLSGALQSEQPYYLLDAEADWMLGTTLHLVGARRSELPAADFLGQAGAWATAFRKTPPPGVDGALICCGDDYAAAWVHGADSARDDAKAALTAVAALTTPVFYDVLLPVDLSAGLWDPWPGLDLMKTPALSIQLERPS